MDRAGGEGGVSGAARRARRLAEWSLWLDERLLAAVAHRQMMLTLPKRLRPYLGVLSRVAVRTLREFVQAAVGERDVVPGVIVCVQTFGSVAHLHPHLHVLMTDGAFRRDGTFVPLPEPDPAVLEELWRRAMLAEFVRHGWLDEDAATGMLSWPHSGFGGYIGPRMSSDTQSSALRRHPDFRTRPPVNSPSDHDFPSILLSWATPSAPQSISCPND